MHLMKLLITIKLFNNEKDFLSQKEALVKEYKKCDEAAKEVLSKLNHLYAEKIMDIMRSHDVNEIVLYDESMSEYFPEYEENYFDFDEDYGNQRYYTFTRENGPMEDWESPVEYWICRLAIISDELKMRVQVWDKSSEEYGEEEEEWRDFSEISSIEDLKTKENLISYLEESDEAFNVAEEYPELLALEEE